MSTERYPLKDTPRLHGLPVDQDRSIGSLEMSHELALMCRAASQAVGAYLVKSRTLLDDANTDTKTDFHDPVTPYDQATELAIGQILGFLVPGSRMLGEEHGEELLPGGDPLDLPDEVAAVEPDFHVDARSLASRVRWIVDPIDGTSNFAAGLTYFGTSIAAELDGEVVAGAINVPAYKETFWANQEHGWLESDGTFYDLVSGGVDGTTTIDSEAKAVLLTYFPTVSVLSNKPTLAAEGFASLAHAFRAVRRPGAAAVDLAQVAAGRAGALYATTLKPWDVAAGIHLVKVSGGTVHQRDLGKDLPEGLQPAVAAASAGLEVPTLIALLDRVQAELS